MGSLYHIGNTQQGERPQRPSIHMTSTDTSLPQSDDNKSEKPMVRTLAISDDVPKYAASIPHKVSWWSLHPAWSMYAFFLVGSVCAVGHHFYFRSLHGQTPDMDQSRKVGYGTLMAFLTSTCLVSSVSTAFRQRTWNTLLSKRLSLRNIDSLFALTEGPMAVLDWEVSKTAKVATLLAVYTWLGPIMVILAGLSISVEQTAEPALCPGVNTLDFSQEGLYTQENFTLHQGDSLFKRNSVSWFWTASLNFYESPSESMQRMANTSAAQKETLEPQQQSTNGTCGDGWNCHYTINFTGPGYKCEDLSQGPGPLPQTFKNQTSPIDPSTLFPHGNYTYHAIANQGDYPQANYAAPIPPGSDLLEAFGTFRTEPIIWTGYSRWSGPANLREQFYLSDPPPEYYTPHFFACELWETEYEVGSWHYQGNQRVTTKVLSRSPIKPFINTTLTHENADDGTPDNTTAFPKDNYVFPQPDTYTYGRTAAFHSLGKVFRNFVHGVRLWNDEVHPSTYTDARYTKLFPNREVLFPVVDLMGATQSMFEDILLSMLSDEQMLPVVPAAEGVVQAQGASKQDTNDTQTQTQGGGYPCTRTKSQSSFQYNWRVLVLVYGVSLILAAASIAVGTWSVVQNQGVLQNTRFTSIAVLLQHCEYGCYLPRESDVSSESSPIHLAAKWLPDGESSRG